MDSKTSKVSWDNSMTFVLSMLVAVERVFLAVLMIVVEGRTLDKRVTRSADSTMVDRHYLSPLH